MTFAEVVRSLRRYDDAPVDTQTSAIFVAEPWIPLSEATVKWSCTKGGVPVGHKPFLFHLTTVKAALKILGPEYDALVASGEVEAICRKLADGASRFADRYYTRFDLNVDNPSAGALLTVVSSNTPPEKRMPRIVNYNFLPDMGRMTA